MKKQANTVCAAICLILMAGGCAGMDTAAVNQGKTVQKGERVVVNYSCSSKEFGLFETTDIQVANNPDTAKSRIFIPPKKTEPASIVAGIKQPGQPDWDLKDLTQEIRNKLALTLPGHAYGSVYETTIESEIPEGMEENNRFRNIPRQRTVPRFRKIPVEQFVMHFGFDPKEGQLLYSDDKGTSSGCAYARIAQIKNDTVTTELLPESGCTVEAPWGTAHLVDQGDKDQLTSIVDTKIGLLVRTGPVIGEVVNLSKDTIRVDYGHPFAGEALKCQVDILEKKGEKK